MGTSLTTMEGHRISVGYDSIIGTTLHYNALRYVLVPSFPKHREWWHCSERNRFCKKLSRGFCWSLSTLEPGPVGFLSSDSRIPNVNTRACRRFYADRNDSFIYPNWKPISSDAIRIKKVRAMDQVAIRTREDEFCRKARQKNRYWKSPSVVSFDTSIQASDSCTIFSHAQTRSWADTNDILSLAAHHEHEGTFHSLGRVVFSKIMHLNIFVKVEILRRHVSSEANLRKGK